MTDTTTTVGELGEEVAVRFLTANGCKILDRNFQRKYGELDVVAFDKELIFIEVKAVRCRIPDELPEEGSNRWRPEENVGSEKRKRLRRIVQIYLDQMGSTTSWRTDLLCVYLDTDQNTARVKWLRNIII